MANGGGCSKHRVGGPSLAVVATAEIGGTGPVAIADLTVRERTRRPVERGGCTLSLAAKNAFGR